MRTQDAVPDELEIIPDGGDTKPSSTANHQASSSSLRGTPIPKTVVQKVDTVSPSHGDIPGTTAHSKRKADAIPDVIIQQPNVEGSSGIVDRGSNSEAGFPISKTVATEVALETIPGQVPKTDASNMRKEEIKPDLFEKKGDDFGKQKDVLLGSV